MAEFYDQLKEENGQALEIIFISSDNDDDSFKEYYGSMPWIAVPYSKRDIAQKLGQKFAVRGIPTLVILDSTGAIKDKDGRSTVSNARGDVSKATQKWA